MLSCCTSKQYFRISDSPQGNRLNKTNGPGSKTRQTYSTTHCKSRPRHFLKMHLLTLLPLSETQTATSGKVAHCSHINRSQAGSQALCRGPALRLCSSQINCTKKRSERWEMMKVFLFSATALNYNFPGVSQQKAKSEKTTEQPCWPSTTLTAAMTG